MEHKDFCVIVFESTHFAIAAESLLKEKAYKIEIIPTPREITASCGLSIRFEAQLSNEVQREMKDGNIGIKGIYQMIKTEKGRGFKPIP
ncbi:DUF3343 domain-containing protein [Alkaliphilus hydrothermalis]|uniref:Putative Se/S carrier protein-like domain-containing protein n=1 Tax=Alkaliphilus hydrothermalis TaxID=1482730 RepID=A0ABS2NP13_9FIRM|nr:DUF3343 domain-containing protein [Alkaliphilus hydrothermalis]MBM7614685.1 hypothetical protein [Alkaliphilus hydrothermalis]